MFWFDAALALPPLRIAVALRPVVLAIDDVRPGRWLATCTDTLYLPRQEETPP